ncbi:MAG: ATP-binding protein [Treponema sp.]|nr:ATP-binding protein [Treponema sp.]
MTRTRDADTHAFLMVLAAFAVFSVFSLIEAFSHGLLIFVFTAVFLLFTCCLIVLMHSHDAAKKEAFSIPFTFFIANTVKCFLTGDYAHYFPLCLGICCLGALFFNKRELLKYILISNLIIALQVIFYFPMLSLDMDSRFDMTMTATMQHWIISLIGSISVYMVATLAETKNNDARNAQDSFVGALSSTPDPMILLDSLNRVTYISNSFMKIIRLEESYLAKGRSVFDLLKDQNLKNLFYELLTKGDSFQTTREVILDGQQFFFEIVVSKLAGSKGYFVNIVNITPVMKAKFEAEAASRSKSAFLATMSHEIRTPLNAIIGLSDIELQNEHPEDTRTNIEKIHTSGENLLSIINDILDISKIETGNLTLNPVDYDLPSLVNDTVQLNIVRVGSKNITFKLSIDETMPVRLFGDELRIKQILNNLLSNAIKYTEEGSVTLTIAWERKNENAWIIFTVKDTGQGIKQNDLPKLFSEYRQLDTKANRHIEGTGLGLSITKNLVSLMDGKIGVESKYGLGSVFTAQFPQRIIDETPIGVTIKKNLESFHFHDVTRSKSLGLVRSFMPYGKVLVVDDVETNLDVAKGLLMPYGLSIETASSGIEAIEKIQITGNKDEASRYDIIFMDHMMPGMDGLETVKVIRNELLGKYYKTVPIVALTANALTGNERMFLANGFNAFISKPIDVLQLDAVLNTLVRNKQPEEILRMAEMELLKQKKDDQVSSGTLDKTVAGIDFEQGRERYNGEGIYLDILRSWRRHTPSLLEKMKGLSRETLQEYAVTVHGLKGSSYGIFANEIGKKAEELEGLAKAGNFEGVQAENAGFIKMTESLMSDLDGLLMNADAGKSEKQRMPSPDPALLASFLDAARRYKSTLMEEILDNLESYVYESGGELVAWLREQTDNLEYEAICSRLEELG